MDTFREKADAKVFVEKPNVFIHFVRFFCLFSFSSILLLLCWVGRVAWSTKYVVRTRIVESKSQFFENNNQNENESIEAMAKRWWTLSFYRVFLFFWFGFIAHGTCRPLAPGPVIEINFISIRFIVFRHKLTVEMILIGDLCRCTFSWFLLWPIFVFVVAEWNNDNVGTEKWPKNKTNSQRPHLFYSFVARGPRGAIDQRPCITLLSARRICLLGKRRGRKTNVACNSG